MNLDSLGVSAYFCLYIYALKIRVLYLKFFCFHEQAVQQRGDNGLMKILQKCYLWYSENDFRNHIFLKALLKKLKSDHML